jgi:DhnA family fructose-bisphosphate aldolase class Ia
MLIAKELGSEVDKAEIEQRLEKIRDIGMRYGIPEVAFTKEMDDRIKDYRQEMESCQDFYGYACRP